MLIVLSYHYTYWAISTITPVTLLHVLGYYTSYYIYYTMTLITLLHILHYYTLCDNLKLYAYSMTAVCRMIKEPRPGL